VIVASGGAGPIYALPGSSAVCPACSAVVIPKCGPIVTWHWAHKARDCDPWSEPESAWHLGWKQFAHRSEVVIERDGVKHRADIVDRAGVVVELQSSYLPAVEIWERERFYGRMVWLYRSTWLDRLHFGPRGFWWKHGSKAMAMSREPVFWDVLGEGEVWLVRLNVVTRYDGSERVLGRITGRCTPAEFAAKIAKEVKAA